MQTETNHSVHITWNFAHPPAKIWQAWTDPSIASYGSAQTLLEKF